MSTAIVDVSGLVKRFGDKPVLQGVDLSIAAGQHVGLVGNNGEGKTTLLRLILGLLQADEGNITIKGEAVSYPRSRSQKLCFGYLPESVNFYPSLSGRRTLRYLARLKGVAAAEADPLLELVGLRHAAEQRVKTYSKGMRQRLGLAQALLGNPELLLLDEPTNGLDPEGMVEIRELIIKLAEMGITIFLASHLLTEVERVCSHVAIIKNGTLLRQGTVEEVTGGVPTYKVRASDLDKLLSTVNAFDQTNSSRREHDWIIVELKNNDAASLNRFLSEQGIYVSQLSEQERSLEDAFMEITADADQAKSA